MTPRRLSSLAVFVDVLLPYYDLLHVGVKVVDGNAVGVRSIFGILSNDLIGEVYYAAMRYAQVRPSGASLTDCDQQNGGRSVRNDDGRR